MREASVIGTPISHTLSPAIFSFLAKQAGIDDFKYSAQEVQPNEIKPFVAGAKKNSNYVGLNVTIPHKRAIIGELDETASEAKALGAVNVVHFKRTSSSVQTIGYNTDVIGVAKTLEEKDCRIRGETAWLFGAGGAARAVAYVLGQQGAENVYIRNRDEARARELAKDIGAIFPYTLFSYVDSDFVPKEQTPCLVVNATSLGLKEKDEAFFSCMNKIRWRSDTLGFDLIYNPEKTPFLLVAERIGLKRVGGLDMLIFQAIAAWEIWFGPLENLKKLKRALSEHLRHILLGSVPIFLTGFMGVGKSGIGSVLAERLGWKFVDTDQIVEQEAGLSIAQIFQTHGEAHFRELEQKVVIRATSYQNTVVSLGGGALMDPESLRAVEERGNLVYLSASPELLQNRLGKNAEKRPLLAGLDRRQQLEKIQALLKIREPIYQKAKFTVTTDHKNFEETAEVISNYFKYGSQGEFR